MFRKLSNIRYMYIRSHLYGLFLTAIILLSILLSIYVLFEPNWINVTVIFTFILIYVCLGIMISIYAGFKSSGNFKERLDYISVLITQFANGNYQSRLQFNENDEVTRISKELNELGEKLQNQVKSLQRMADENASFAKSAHKAAVMEERQRLARDLHDSVSQQLFALTMLSEAALKQIDTNPELAKEQLFEVTSAGVIAQSEMRALLLHLRPVYLSGEPLTKGVRQLIGDLQQKCPINFDIQMDEELELTDTTEEHVFRIIQESLANILRHSHATKVTLNIFRKNDELFVHVSDNGQGFNIDKHIKQKTSYGLKTMQERSEELGGTFNIRSKENEGTYIDIRIPC
ncbi:MAG TPA: sensor histidine kinase [Virgibacillus sp.]|nr:sensor histidine kinase [Virgibacillus sp.]